MIAEQSRILAVDDEPHLQDLLRGILQPQGIEVLEAYDGEEAIERLRRDSPDLLLLDLGLPDCDGMDLLQQVRAESTIPVIIVSVRSDEPDKIRGLELGADDYVTKPYSGRELLARIRAVLRRADPKSAPRDGRVEVDDYLQVDFSERVVWVGGQSVRLRPTEYRLLSLLIQHAGHTLSFDRILQEVWGSEYHDETHYVHLYVTYLRQKIEPDPSRPRYILTRRGLGYQFAAVLSAPKEC